jgi:mannose-6-phosphate isomerase-like protein (cupin superfamily)
MAENIPVRRVVTGDDAQGRSGVLIDGDAPNVHQASSGPGRNHVDIWAWQDPLAPLSGDRDDGDLAYDFPGPPLGGHLRIVQMVPRPADYDPAADREIVPEHPRKLRPPSRVWDRGGKNVYTSNMHMTETVDYGIVLSGERVMYLDDAELLMRPGDVVVQLGAWHQWSSPRIGCQMAFDMIAARLDPRPRFPQLTARPFAGADGNGNTARTSGSGRRIVTINTEDDRSRLVSDAPGADVSTDPARPGYRSVHIWATDVTPASFSLVSARPGTIVPPPGGSLCRIVTVPPDAGWQGQAGSREVARYFAEVGAPEASRYSAQAAHPYLQQTRTLEFCMVIEGEPTLFLDRDEVKLHPGQVAVIRGSTHAWGNSGSSPAVLAITSHDGTA